MSPSAATRTRSVGRSGGEFIPSPLSRVLEAELVAPLRYVDLILRARQQRSAADALLGDGKIELLLRPVQQPFQYVRRDLARIGPVDKAEHQQVSQHNFPLDVHMGQEAIPVQLRPKVPDHVENIRSV